MPLDPFARLEAARELLDAGRPDRAAGLLAGSFPKPLAGERLFLTADALRAQGYFSRAQAAYRAALAAIGREERDLATDAHLGLARCARSLGQIREARRAMAAARRTAGRPSAGLAGILALEDALVDRAEGLYPLALKKLAPLLAACRREKDWSGVGFILWATGGARRFSGDLAGAHRDFKESLAAFRRAGDREGETYALFGLGGIARVRGLFPEARRAYADAGRLLGSGPDVFGRAYAHCGLANVLRQLGLWDEAERNYHRSYKLYAELDDRVDLAYVDWGLGQVHLKRGELAQAERRLRAAYAAFKKGAEARGEALSLQSLAQVLHARGRTAEAERLFDSAVRRARGAGLHAHLEIFT
ncbi:MAG TPA: tetratricopeptide repeat protein [Elusimicrobiota bacterium]|nr:tetratricopeptide repeat protein [Elusimicrobiota bacterium]